VAARARALPKRRTYTRWVFNIGPMELGVLILVGLIVIGPERLPGFARDAARMIRTLRDLANNANKQLRDEIGPELDDLNLSENLDVLNDLRSLNPRRAITQALLGEPDAPPAATPEPAASPPAVSPAAAQPAAAPKPPGQQPLARGEKTPYDTDAT